jgi:hypothetical protein
MPGNSRLPTPPHDSLMNTGTKIYFERMQTEDRLYAQYTLSCYIAFNYNIKRQEVRLSPLGTSATIWPIIPAPDDRWWVWSNWWNENWQGKPKYLEETCPGATLSTTNPTWPDLGSNPVHRGGKPATNRLSYGTPIASIWYVCAPFYELLLTNDIQVSNWWT